ncbi:hypothetical protein DKL51_28805 [Micromonospora globispora]|nr:hypothetical protein DKL51_28805 [Micromonospora globispora]
MHGWAVGTVPLRSMGGVCGDGRGTHHGARGASNQIYARRFVTHRFDFGEFIRAYDTFSTARETGALEIVLSRSWPTAQPAVHRHRP